jgi:mannose-6-phosphate isomerase-like protein (cupin superfamily)
MAAERILEHPVWGDRLIVLVSAEESGGELFRFEYVSHPGRSSVWPSRVSPAARAATPAPDDHVHAEQEERVLVLAGTLRCRVAGREHLLGAGQSLIVPAGVPHAVWNAGASGSRSIGEFRPARDTQAMLEAYFVAA